MEKENDFIIFGHYDVPPINQNVHISKSSSKTIENQLTTISNLNLYKWGKGVVISENNLNTISAVDDQHSLDQNNSSITDENSEQKKSVKIYGILKTIVQNLKFWFDHEENTVLKGFMIVVVGLFIAMFW